ncbi:prepilin-type N-terminal cleavage/methylation domain-containing protein [Zoogloea sp.]|uniref:prepilin-type N-terminal cleavage/methylation domain-containing protein n=1 Tax=Zoogloea sp. TaxID=49181 RepID=UPI0035B255D4
MHRMHNNNAPLHQQQRGFTLVEMAVVLVVIGLLLGGVLKGQELINSARVKNLVNDFRTTASHLHTYQDRFRSLPGDDPGAAAHLAGAITASTGGTVGNGRVDGNWNSTTATDESLLFWQHVRLANLAGGDGRNPGAEGMDVTTWLPRNAVGGRIGVTSTSPITGWSGSLFVCQDNISGRLAQQVDINMDDGLPNTGSVRLMANGSATSAAIAPADLNETALYTVCTSA